MTKKSNKISPAPTIPTTSDAKIGVALGGIDDDLEKKVPPSFSSTNSTTTPSDFGSTCSVPDEVMLRPGGISRWATLLNFVKGMIGPGCLSLPLALKQAGLWTAFGLICIFGFLNNFCMLQLVKSSQHLSRNKGQVLDYGGVAYEACANSFMPLRKYKHVFKFLCNTVIIFLQVGICSVFYVFVATHAQEIVESQTDFRATSTQWSLIVLLPMALVNLISTLKVMAILSLAGNVCMILSLIFIMQFLLRQEHLLGELPTVTNFDGILMACGSILYSFEGQAMVLPMENKLKHPKQMLGPFGVLSQGMFIVTAVYAACGFFGYITYGEHVKGSITLNLPDTTLFIVVKALLVFVIYAGFVIQQYVIVDMVWPSLKRLLGIGSKGKLMDFATESAFRTCLLTGELLLAILVPTLEQIIPLVGATAGMLLAFVFPALIDTLTFAPVWRETGPRWRMWWNIGRNGSLCILGIFGLIAGLQSNIRNLVETGVSPK